MTLPVTRADNISYLIFPPIVGHGPDASIIYDMLDEALSHARQSGPLELAREILYETYLEHSKENWDGEGANAITKDAYLEALEFLRLLPTTLTAPGIVAEPTGEIAMEWYKDTTHVFIVSFAGNNILTFAGLYGEVNTVHGTEQFQESIPQTIAENIGRLYSFPE